MSDLELMFTTCFICQEKYYDANAENGSRDITCQRHPIQSFRCGHVLCAVCIASMHVAKVERDSESDNDWITCPFCNTPNSFHPIEQISSLLVKQYQEMKRTDGNRQGQQQRMSKSSDTSSDTDISSDSDAAVRVVSTILPTAESNEPCRKVTVTGAGIEAVNGDFVQSGTVDFAPKYDKTGILDGEEVTFTLYRCQLLDRTRRWFISIVPRGSMPGTNKDIDFYTAKWTPDDGNEMPQTGWEVVKPRGELPVPTVLPCMSLSSDTPGRFVSTILPTVESNEPCRKLTVTGAGIDAINGDFVHSGSKDFAPKFNKTGFFDGGEVMFSLYRCQLLDRSRKWYISIVPPNTEPGTTARDIDFYYATCTSEDSTEVPETGWMVVRTLPVPTVVPFSVGRQ